MASRDEILADFQACTGIEDYEMAIVQLEASNWVLVDAVNKFLPNPNASTSGNPVPPPNHDISENYSPLSRLDTNSASTSTNMSIPMIETENDNSEPSTSNNGASGSNIRQHNTRQTRSCRDTSSQSNSSSQNQNIANDVNIDEDDDNDEEFEDANSEVAVIDDDDFGLAFAPSSSASGSSKITPLIPDDYGDETMGAIKFAEEFVNRYGHPAPSFFQGTLEEAVKEACNKPARERKMVALYLHHDSSVLTNVFCTQALCAESIVSFLNENFISFGWDISYYSNRQRAVTFITQQFGSVAASTVRNMSIDKLPVLALAYKLRGTLEIFQIINGSVTLDELMSQLLSAHETYNAQLGVEIKEERAREARNAVKREQDLAFEMAQQADREKDEKKKRDQEQKLEEERVQEAIRKSQEEAKAKAEEEKKQMQNRVRATLPKEPPLDSKGKVARIRFRDVLGERQMERRFLASHKLQIVFNYLISEGYAPEDYKVLSSWPRRDLTTVDHKQTLEELKMFPQETLTLEEK